jgi:hypothetical protein
MRDSKETGSARFRLTRRDLVSAAVLGAAATGAAAAGLANPDDELAWDDMEPVAYRRRMPTTPNFPRRIDGYTPYTGQTKCRPIARPGVIGVRDIVLRTYGNRGWRIAARCTGSVSEHYDGRALDVAFNAHNYASRRNATDFLYWMLRTDRHGNGHAMARRLGVMYIIWNRRIWRSYRPTIGWQPYSGTPNPHTDHIHISFGWWGALKKTTYWTLPRT